MNKTDYVSKVKEFHELFDAPILDKPTIPSMERAMLRVNLIQEELNELKQAIEDGNLVECVDAFCDIQYVTSGALHEFGMANNFDEAFDEVHRSNMSKACETIEVANETVKHYANKGEDSVDSYIKEKDGKYLVYRTSDDKILKSINYSPANLEKFV